MSSNQGSHKRQSPVEHTTVLELPDFENFSDGEFDSLLLEKIIPLIQFLKSFQCFSNKCIQKIQNLSQKNYMLFVTPVDMYKINAT